MNAEQANQDWLQVVSITDAMRRYAEQQQWSDVATLATQRQAQLSLFFARLGDVNREQRESIIHNAKQLLAADQLLMTAANEIKTAMAQGLAQIQQGRKAINSYQGCASN